MTRYKPPKPTIIQVSPHETLVVFPYNPKASRATSGNAPFAEIKHLLSDKPLTPPYRGDLPRESNRTPKRKPKRAPKRAPKRKASRKSSGKPRGTRRRESGD
jgi:hypothetical protein